MVMWSIANSDQYSPPFSELGGVFATPDRADVRMVWRKRKNENEKPRDSPPLFGKGDELEGDG
jgi:hypothetical protein